ncbi:MAG: GGDEF domain-containing protein [Desulfoplanes sp.]
MPTPSSTVYDEELFILNYASRLFMAITNKKTFLRTVLETFADFGKSLRVGILLLDSTSGELTPGGLYSHGIFSSPLPAIPDGIKKILDSHEIQEFPLADGPFPLPVIPGSLSSTSERCLCIPIAQASNNIHALITLAIHAGELDFEALQRLRVISSVCALSLENMRLFEMAIFDGLTGVHVRRYFEIKAKEELAKMQRNPYEMGIILMDIDGFKTINDQFGHVAGDKVLMEFALRISGEIRKDIDIVCRYGGDEFVVLLPQTSSEQTKNVANRILAAVHRKHYSALPTDRDVSISAGAMTIGPDENITTQELVHRVDQLLYAGKQSGGNTVICMEGKKSRPL